MQGTIAMLMVLGGLGCHHRGCNDCYATPNAGGCYSACYDVGYMPYAPACYAGTYAGMGCFGSCYGGGCFGSCYSGCYGSCYGGCYGGKHGHRNRHRHGLFGCRRQSCGACNPCSPVYLGCYGGCYGGGCYNSCYGGAGLGGWVGALGGMSHFSYAPEFGSYTPVYGAPVDTGFASAQGASGQYLTTPQAQTAPSYPNDSDLAPTQAPAVAPSPAAEVAPETATPPAAEPPPAEPTPAPAEPAPANPGGELNVPPPPVNSAPGL